MNHSRRPRAGQLVWDMDIFDQIIELLERERMAGKRVLPLARDELAALATPPAGPPGPSRAATAAPSAGRSREPSRTRDAADRGFRLEAEKSAPAVASMDWDALSGTVSSCTRCPLSRTRTQVVFGEGARNADIMFIGEGPGYQEDQSGRPFVGPAGQLLTRMIRAMQYDRESVFIANIVKCRPPGNRNPNEEEAAACLPYLHRQIELVDPEVLVLLGAVPLTYLLGKSGITRLHGTWLEYRGRRVMPTFHPSYLLRSPQKKKEAWDDLKRVMEFLGRDPEETLRRLKEKNRSGRETA